jgi:capsular polysaccharide biosynthesis protein
VGEVVMRDLAISDQIGEIYVSPIYASYPNIYQRHLIPENAFPTLNNRWGTEIYAAPSVKFYRLNSVYVLAEGLVFRDSGELVAETKTAHSEIEVQEAKKCLEQALLTPEKILKHDRAVLCKKRGADNYGHWLVEMLPKAYWARQKMGVVDWPVVVHKTSVAMQSIMQQSLAVIGVSEDKTIITDRAPVYFEELLLVEGLSGHSVFISPLVMECMEFIASKAGGGSGDSLYAVRRPAKTRDFEDEPEAKKIFLENGYREIEAANLSFLEQVAAFKSAKRVVGPMGAALTNIIFCRPGTEVLVFMPASALELFFWHIAEGKKLDYFEVRCEEVGPQQAGLPWNRLLRIASSAIKNILARLRYIQETPLISVENSTLPSTPISHFFPSANESMTHNKKKLVTQELSVDFLLGQVWEYATEGRAPVSTSLYFNSDGKIGGYTHVNEASWELDGKFLKIFHEDGNQSWTFCLNADSAEFSLLGTYHLDVSHREKQILRPVNKRPVSYKLANIHEISTLLGSERVKQIKSGGTFLYKSNKCRLDESLEFSSTLPLDQTNILDELQVPGYELWEINNASIYTRHGLIIIEDFIVAESAIQFPTQSYPGISRFLNEMTLPDRGSHTNKFLVHYATNGNLENYFHFFLESLSRLWSGFFIDMAQNTKAEILIPTSRTSYQTEMLDIVSCRFPDNAFFTIDGSDSVHAEKLVFSKPYPASSLYPNDVTLEFVSEFKETYFDLSKSNYRVPQKKIYVSRRDSSNRVLENEETIEAELQIIGFEIVQLSGLSLSQQIDLFHSASFVVSPHGAGLTNVVFCQPGTKVLEIHMKDNMNWVYRRLCNVFKLNYEFIVGSPKESGDCLHVHARSYSVPVDSLLTMICTMDNIQEDLH